MASCIMCQCSPAARGISSRLRGTNILIAEVLQKMGWRVGRKKSWSKRKSCETCYGILAKWANAEMKLMSAGADFYERTGYHPPKVMLEKRKKNTKKSILISLIKESHYRRAMKVIKLSKRTKKAWLNDLRETVQKEMKKIVKIHTLFPSSSVSLEQFDWDHIIRKLRKNSPIIYSLLLALLTKSNNTPRICEKSLKAKLGMMYMIPLHHRKPRIHKCIPQSIASMLLRCGAEGKTILTLHRLGISKCLNAAYRDVKRTQRNDETLQSENSSEEPKNSLKQMQSRLGQEDGRIEILDEILGDEDVNGLDVVEDAEESNSESEDGDDDDDEKEESGPAKRPRGKCRQALQQKNPRVFDEMDGALSDDDSGSSSDDSGSSGDDSDGISVIDEDQDGDRNDRLVDEPPGKQQDEDSDDDL